MLCGPTDNLHGPSPGWSRRERESSAVLTGVSSQTIHIRGTSSSPSCRRYRDDMTVVNENYTGHVDPGTAARRTLPGATIIKASVGPMDNNAYLITCSETGDTLLIDAANDSRPDDRVAVMAPGAVGAGRSVTRASSLPRINGVMNPPTRHD